MVDVASQPWFWCGLDLGLSRGLDGVLDRCLNFVTKVKESLNSKV